MNKTIKSATTTMWVEYWLYHVNNYEDIPYINGEKLSNGKWKCEIELPLINKVVKSVSSTEVNSIINASKKAANLIDEYVKDHPQYRYRNIFKGKEWRFTENENGELVSRGLSEKAIIRSEREAQYIDDESIKAVEKAIKRIKRVNGSDKGLAIQVIEQYVIGENLSDKEIATKIWQLFQKTYGYEVMPVKWARFGTKIITIGYTFKNEQ